MTIRQCAEVIIRQLNFNTGFRWGALIWGLCLLFPARLSFAVDCKAKIGETIGDLRRLRIANEEDRKLCTMNSSETINIDTANPDYQPAGDCQQTYRVVSKLGDQIEQRLKESCDAFNDSQACQMTSQNQCFGYAGLRFQMAGTKLREATLLIAKAREILERKVRNNDDDINQYAKLGNFDPRSLLGQPPSDITGAQMRYYKLAKEQFLAMKRGEQFLAKAGPVENKLNGYQAKLNAMGANSYQRANNLGQAGSTITSNPQQMAQASQMGSVAGDFFSQAMSGGGGPSATPAGSRAFSEADFVLKPNEIHMSEDQFFSALDGKPLPMNLAAKMPKAENSKGDKGALAANVHAPGEGGPNAEQVMAMSGASQLDSGSAKLSPADYSNSIRTLASMPAKPEGSGLSMTGASTPGFAGKVRSGTAKEPNEAMANYEKASGSPKLIDRTGPSLRDLLKQHLNEGGASTRAMHEVLAGLKDLPGDNASDRKIAADEKGVGDTQASGDDIKGIETESLFVRIRAAHLRFQNVRVTDI